MNLQSRPNAQDKSQLFQRKYALFASLRAVKPISSAELCALPLMRIVECEERQRLAEQSIRMFEEFRTCRQEWEETTLRRQRKRPDVIASEVLKRFDAATKQLTEANLQFLRHCEEHGCAGVRHICGK